MHKITDVRPHRVLSDMRFPPIKSRQLALGGYRSYTNYDTYFRACRNMSVHATIAYAYARTYADG